ncbi:pre-tRNA nuclear export protein [Haplosporangium sp. Z 767]|nr:pre-tRNA nuclear export protein [Haplosporangium sp. Z 767]KAF9191890.1 pre-tRNA nuclear export protein [Haplosporangium sp. Z 11]
MDHIEEAVACALSPTADPALKQQATQYCEQVKASPDGWQSCLTLYIREPKSTPETRLFCLQVVEEVLLTRSNTLDESRLNYFRQTFMDYIRREFVNEGLDNTLSSEPPYLKNKFAHAVALLFRQTYLKSWPTFFTDMLALIAPLPQSAGTSNMKMVDLFLRILMSIDEEVVNTLSSRISSREENTLNINIKDRMREQDVPILANAWYELLKEYKERSLDFAEMQLRIVGVYVAWIDINLIVNQRFLSLIYSFLLTTSIRNAAADCLTDIIKKGMKPLDKLQLIEFLGIVEVLQQVDLASDSEFRERVARLVNNLGLQLCQIWQDTNPQANSSYPPTASPAAYNHISQLVPILLQFLRDDNENVSEAVFGFLRETLNIFKTIKKATGTLPQEQKVLMRQILESIVMKMKYGEDMDWVCVAIAGGSESVGTIGEDSIGDEDMLNFLEMRRELKRFYDQIATLSASLTTNFLHSAVTTTLTTFVNEKASGSTGSSDWRDLELALYLLYLYGEAIKGVPQFAVGAPSVGANGGKIVHPVPQAGAPLTPLGECLFEMCKSGVSAYPHPSVSANFFEIACRYANFFEVRPDCIPDALEAFVGNRGVHHPITANRTRAWYLFWRFTKDLKFKLTPYVETVLNSIQDVLTVEASLPQVLPVDFDLSTFKDPAFETKTYLYEAVGLLISQESIPAQQQFEYLSVVVNPFLAEIQKSLEACRSIQSSSNGVIGDGGPVGAGSPRHHDLELVWTLHHRLMALGSFAKGFPDFMNKKTSTNTNTAGTTPGPGPCGQIFKQVAEITLIALETLSRFEVIRSAARYTFGRLINCLGQEVQPYLPTLITGLLQECSIMELVEFLPFMGQVAHKFKATIMAILNGLLFPLIQKVFFFLNQVPNGTDEAMALIELRKSYLGFLMGLFSSELENVLITEANGQHLNLILQSVLHYAQDMTDVPVSRMAFGILLKAVNSWGSQSESSAGAIASSTSSKSLLSNDDAKVVASNGTGSVENVEKLEAPGFYQFMYEHILRITFEVPMKPTFDLQDGQSVLVLGEIAGLQKAIALKQGDAFLNYLNGVYLPLIQCPPELAQEYVQALQQLDAKQFKKYFQAFIQKSRS